MFNSSYHLYLLLNLVVVLLFFSRLKFQNFSLSFPQWETNALYFILRKRKCRKPSLFPLFDVTEHSLLHRAKIDQDRGLGLYSS